jgi:glycosyltransferase involved in cell wall biosynthesis
MTKMLFIARHFPPDGGGGVQRALKFVKYLRDFEIDPIVLTGSDPRTSRYVPEDSTICGEVPDTVEVFRVRYDSADPPVHERVDSLIVQGRMMMIAHNPKVIFVTTSPFEDLRVAETLSSEFKVPWIADLRDPWALDEFHIQKSRWHRRRAIKRMEEALSTAALVIMNTPEAERKARQAMPLLAGRIRHLTNGYDAADFIEKRDFKKADCFFQRDAGHFFSIVHSGALHTQKGLNQRRWKLPYALLGKMEPGVCVLARSHFFLLRALEQWIASQPERIHDVRLVLAGVVTEADKRIVKSSSVSCLVDFAGYLPHSESVSLVRNAGILFLPLHAVGSGRRASIVPGKTYEYMASGRPILGALPEGDARNFLRRAGSAWLVRPTDVAGMVEALKVAYRNWKQGLSTLRTWDPDWVAQFERRALTRRLAELAIGVTGDGPRSGADSALGSNYHSNLLVKKD